MRLSTINDLDFQSYLQQTKITYFLKYSLFYILQIESSNEIISTLMQRIQSMESCLKDPNIESVKRKIIETELNEIKKLLTTNKELLSKLHKDNSKSFALTACLVFLCFLVYGIYVMIYGTG